MTLPVSEVFGPVYQGEGPHTGRRCSFVRLGLCNLRCSWCDTPFTWDSTRYDVNAECPPMTAGAIAARLADHDTDLLVLSGGEPLIHQRNDTLKSLLADWPGHVHVETNGTLTPAPWLRSRVQHFSVSPKLGNQGDPYDRRIRSKPLHAFALMAHAERCAWKFVVTAPEDLAEVDALVAAYSVPRRAVWIMPEGVDRDAVLATATRIEHHVTQHGYNLTLRQHVLIHGNERGY
jgi:organic radical activating enzyme